MPPEGEESTKLELNGVGDDGDGSKHRILGHVLDKLIADDDKKTEGEKKATPSPLPKTEKKDEDERDNDGERDEDEDEEETDDADDDSDETELEAAGDDGEEEEEEEEEEKGPKPVRVKYSDGELYEVPSDAKVIVKVNGEDQEVAIRDIADQYSAKFNADRELNKAKDALAKADKQKRQNDAVAEEFLKIDKIVTDAFEATKLAQNGKGDPLSALKAMYPMVRLAGWENPVDWVKMHIEQMSTMLSELGKLDGGEQNAFLQSLYVDYYKSEAESRTQAEQQARPRQQTIAEIKRVRKEHDVSDEEWDHAVGVLDAVHKSGKAADYGITKFTPQLAATLVLEKRVADRAERLISDNAPAYEQKAGAEKFAKSRRRLIRLIQAEPELGDDELGDMVREAYGSPKDADDKTRDAKILGKKVGSARPLPRRSAKPSKEKAPRSWKELDAIIAKQRADEASTR